MCVSAIEDSAAFIPAVTISILPSKPPARRRHYELADMIAAQIEIEKHYVDGLCPQGIRGLPRPCRNARHISKSGSEASSRLRLSP